MSGSTDMQIQINSDASQNPGDTNVGLSTTDTTVIPKITQNVTRAIANEPTQGTNPSAGSGEVPKGNKVQDQENITPEHPRFKEVVYKMRENERIAKEQAAMLAKIYEKNQQLETQLTTFTTTQVNSQLSQQLQNLQSQKRQHQEDSSWDLVNQIDDQILDLKVKQQQLKTQQIPTLPTQTTHPINPIQNNIPQEAYAAIEVFKGNNPWFEVDAVMTGAATALDQQLMRDPEWGQVSISARLKEVEKRVKKEFVHKFPNTGITQSMTDAPQSGPTGGNTQGNKQLTQIEKDMARRLMPGVDANIAYAVYQKNK